MKQDRKTTIEYQKDLARDVSPAAPGRNKKRFLCLGFLPVLLAMCILPAGCGDLAALENEAQKAHNLKEEIEEKKEKRENSGDNTDYSYEDNWLMLPKEITKEADTFYVYPTIVTNPLEDAPPIVDIDDPIMRVGAYDTYVKNATAFEESTNVFAPFYRQTNMAAVADLRGAELEEFHKQEQLTDLYAALDYYFENYNEGRPFFLAGHSQGSILLKLAVEDYFLRHPEYYERMIAAYLVGFSVTEEDLQKYPHMKFAEGPEDTGVVISWNTEGPGNKNADNIVVEKGGISINPISWTRDDTLVPASENPGSRVDDMAGALEDEAASLRYDIEDLRYTTTTIVDLVTKVIDNSFTESHPGIADAQVDPERGVVICTTKAVPFMEMTVPGMDNVFGPESYHGSDYALYYYSVRDNVRQRLEAWRRR